MKSRKITPIAVAGGIIVLLILVLGTVLMVRASGRDTENAVRDVSLLFLDELAGRREQVVEDNLNDNIKVIGIALELLSDEDLSDLEHMQAYQRRIKQLFSLERFAFVDEDGLVYTADDGVRDEMDQV